METRIPDILSKENYEALLEWMADPDAEAPAFAESFMTSLDALYMNRSGRALRRRGSASSRLTLEFLMSEEAQRPPVRHAAPAPNPVLEELTDGPEPLPETPKGQAPRIGDNILPLTDESGFREAGLDSVRVAGAIAWHWSRLETAITKGRQASMSFIQLTLWITYGTLLAERKTRLTAEHPQMWKYGPAFPRVYNRNGKTPISPDREAAEEIRRADPQLHEFLERTVRTNALKGTGKLSDIHTAKSSPWRECLRRNPDKWSTPLDDAETAAWFRKYIDQSKI